MSSYDNKRIKFIDPSVNVKIYSYPVAVKTESNKNYNYPIFRSCFTSWDNEARSPKNSKIFIDSSPDHFFEYLSNMSEYALNNKIANEAIVFINAWNEWAEGAHLEPDRKYGYAWLEVLYQVKIKYTQD